MEKASFVSIPQFIVEANATMDRLELPSNNIGRFASASKQGRRWRSLSAVEMNLPLGIENRRELAATLGRLAVDLFEPLAEGGSDERRYTELLQWSMALDSGCQGILAKEPLEVSRRQFQAVADATTYKEVVRASQYQQPQIEEMLLHFSARAGVIYSDVSRIALSRLSEQGALQAKREAIGGLLDDVLLCAAKVFNRRSFSAEGEAKWELEKVQYQLLWFAYELASWQESKKADEHPLLRFALFREKYPLHRSLPRQSFEAVTLVDGHINMIHLRPNDFVTTTHHPKIKKIVPPFHFREVTAAAQEILATAHSFVRPKEGVDTQAALTEFGMLFYEIPRAF